MSEWQRAFQGPLCPIRAVTKIDDGLLIGAIPCGNNVICTVRDAGQMEWRQQGVVVSCDDGLEYGDAHILHVPGSDICFCAFRIHNCKPDKEFEWQVAVCRSADMGVTWDFDSVIDTSSPGGPFVGAPFLLTNSQGNMQVYYDNELAPSCMCCEGYQWLTLKERASGFTGDWGPLRHVLDPGTIHLIESGQKPGLLRDGMASVVRTDGDGIMVILETVDTEPPHQNVVKGQCSPDNGLTWGLRFQVYKGRQSETGGFFSAYNPWVCREQAGPTYVAFCTDEDFPEPPDPSCTPVHERRSHVKIVKSLSPDSFESWSEAAIICNDCDSLYNPGIWQNALGDLESTVDMLDGTRCIFVKSFVS